MHARTGEDLAWLRHGPVGQVGIRDDAEDLRRRDVGVHVRCQQHDVVHLEAVSDGISGDVGLDVELAQSRSEHPLCQ